MLISRAILLQFLLASSFARAAALVPLPRPAYSVPLAGFEANRGQARPDILFLNRGSSNLAVTAQAVLFSPFRGLFFGSPGLPLAPSERLPGGRGYHLHFEEVPTARFDEAALNRAIEAQIRRRPEQYLWSYRRYKVPRGVDAPPPAKAEA